MLEFLVGSGLAAAAGLNAWMPLFALGLLDRFVPVIDLPASWSWLSSDVALWITGVLLVVEIVADKIPAVDSVNDVLQTVVRPASGGIAFGAGASAQTVRVDDPSLFAGAAWVPIVVGVVIALALHALKASVRPLANVATAGVAAPVLSAAEDVSAGALIVAAIFAPVLAGALVVALIVSAVLLLRRRRRHRSGTSVASVPRP
ncbi:DUF4126 domain-containing protein [Microbacterium laevaniformans]|uniref:DUF4126 domain-containing protein n=1 Tax=Microbacterium laevaniformans TaxID=36807 RepID=A0A150HH87_9MICO|nr:MULTISPECIES: DUF4126 domain-containing protein [Microbacterium]EXJ51697.1 membrane protein [Microbacterium sp. MRS-1]KXZ61489.1 hypothetical protein Mlaev_00487 [Microbacterium laevaniformans]MBM7752194.1 hypothetical protein [Microbacterium laevaniformans]OJU45836.1 MAG: hypothetical protein BGN98_13495 [Microbacterium sp. 69-7]TGY37649.1 DUF4126 domain-containing protein [Microbacterium laevaniformans]